MMKKWMVLLLSVLMIFSLTACSAQISGEKAVKENAQTVKSTDSAAEKEGSSEMISRKIKVTGQNGEVIVFALNDSQAAQDLYKQLPLTVEVENFSTNEKIFYPADKLNTENTPNPSNVDVGTLAYYRPWGNVVMFYGGLRPNSDLFELGNAVAGKDAIKNLSGTVTVEKDGGNE